MCGIMGVSFAPDSTINRHKLLSALLSEGEARGRDAAGYAWVNPGGSGSYKKNVSGSKLHVGKLPADASAFIAHTRLATHGSPSDNENNHPVYSPDGAITLVHNGVIYNHMAVRGMLGDYGKKLPEVDSSVIPAIIEGFGIDATEHLAGQAACAWFDTETSDTIHLARFNGSPVTYAWLADGSFAFASTPEILGRALNKADVAWFGVYPGPFDSFSPGEYLQILEGDILQEAEVEWDLTYQRGGWSSVNKTTYKGSEDTKPAALTVGTSDKESTSNVSQFPPVGSTFLTGEDDISDADYDFWVTHGYMPYEIDQVEAEEAAENDNPNSDSGHTFYVEEHGGDETNYKSLVDLIASLSWFSNLTATENALVGPEEGQVRWVNTVLDVGHLADDGIERISWVRDKGAADEFGDMPAFVRDGLDKLRTLVGA